MDWPIGGGQKAPDKGHFDAYPDPDTIDWLQGVRWREVIASLSAAERQVALLDAKYAHCRFAAAWGSRLIVGQAAAEAGTLGPTTTAERLRVVAEELNDWAPSLGDREGLLVLRVMRTLWERYRIGGMDEDSARNTILATGREIIDLEEVVRAAGLILPSERDIDADAGDLFALLKDVSTRAHALPPLLRGIAALRATYASGIGGEGCGRIARLVLPAFLRWRSRTAPPPLFLCRSFANAPHAMAPRGDITRWLNRILEALRDEARRGLSEIEIMEERVERNLQALSHRRATSMASKAYELIVEHEVMTGERLARLLRVGGRRITSRAARKLLGELEDLGMLREITGRRSFRIYADQGFVSPRLADPDSLADGPAAYGQLSPDRLQSSDKAGSPPPPLPTSARVEPVEVDDEEWSRLLNEVEAKTQRLNRFLGGD